MDRPRLRDLHHPDLSELLVHFTGRPRPRKDLDRAVAHMSAAERLESILVNQAVWAMRTFYAPVPVVCFTESTTEGLEYMISSAGFEPWGIVFHREVVFERGGGPVFHLRGDEWRHREGMPARLQSRIVKFAPDDGVEWVEEREWRVPYEDGEAGFTFDTDEVVAVIVGDPDWPDLVPKMDWVWGADGWDVGEVPGLPDWIDGHTRWLWNGEQLVEA